MEQRLARNVEGHSGNKRTMRRLSHERTFNSASTTINSIWNSFCRLLSTRWTPLPLILVGDCLSGRLELLSSAAGSNLAGAAGLIRHLRSFFAAFGVPEDLYSDGGPEFTAGPTENFFSHWEIRHRWSSAYFPQSKGRAEVAVKTVKRVLMSNTGPKGSPNNDKFLQAMLQLRNTPDPDWNISPAQIIFGRQLRGKLSFVNQLEKYSIPTVRPTWRQAWVAKDSCECQGRKMADLFLIRRSKWFHKLKFHFSYVFISNFFVLYN